MRPNHGWFRILDRVVSYRYLKSVDFIIATNAAPPDVSNNPAKREDRSCSTALVVGKIPAAGAPDRPHSATIASSTVSTGRNNSGF